MAVNDPKKRYHGFIIPHQPPASEQTQGATVPYLQRTPSNHIDTSYLFSDSDLWNSVAESGKKEGGSDEGNASRADIIMGDATTPSSFDCDGMLDTWASLLPGIEGMANEPQRSRQPSSSAILPAAEYANSNEDRGRPVPTTQQLQSSPFASSVSNASGGSPSMSGAPSSTSSVETAATSQSVHAGGAAAAPTTMPKQSRSLSATTSKVDRCFAQEDQQPTIRHTRTLSQSAGSKERPRHDRRSLSNVGVENGNSGTGKVPRSRSRPSQRNSIGPAARANELLKSASTSSAELKIDTSGCDSSNNVGATGTTPSGPSGVPIPWSASPWTGGHPYPWPSPFAPSSMPASSSGMQQALAGWPYGPHPHHAQAHAQPPPHWPPPFGPGMWYHPHHPHMAAYPFPSPHGTWTFQPGSAGANGQPVVSPPSSMPAADGRSWSADMSRSSESQSQSQSQPFPIPTDLPSNESDQPVASSSAPVFSIEDFLRGHQSAATALFSPAGPDSNGGGAVPTATAEAETASGNTATTSKQSSSSGKARRMSKSSEHTGRVLEDVPEASVIPSRTIEEAGVSNKKSSTTGVKVKKESSSGSSAPSSSVGSVGSVGSVDTAATSVEDEMMDAHEPGNKSKEPTEKSSGRKAKTAAASTATKKTTTPTPPAVTRTGRTVRPDSERRKRRRESHNLVERRRRDAINERIAELASLLPETMLLDAIAHSQGGGNNSKVVKVPMPESALQRLSQSGGTYTPQEAAMDALASAPADSETLAAAQARPNKGIILKKSVDYIRALQEFIEQQASHNRMLQDQIGRMAVVQQQQQHGQQHGNGGGTAPPPFASSSAAPAWPMDRLANTFDLGTFDPSQGSTDSPHEHLHAMSLSENDGESPPQTLADWLASKTLRTVNEHASRGLRGAANNKDDVADEDDEDDDHDDLFSDGGEMHGTSSRDVDGDEKDDADQDDGDDGDDDDDEDDDDFTVSLGFEPSPEGASAMAT